MNPLTRINFRDERGSTEATAVLVFLLVEAAKAVVRRVGARGRADR